jgi:hypothetical protein
VGEGLHRRAGFLGSHGLGSRLLSNSRQEEACLFRGRTRLDEAVSGSPSEAG